MARRRITQAQIRDRRSKRLALVLGVVFLGVMGIQAPKLMKQLHHGAPAAATPPPTSAATGAPAPGATTGASGAAGTATVSVPRQLTSFSLLPLKDPFDAPVHGAVGTPESSDETDADAESAAAKAAEGSTDNESAAAAKAAAATNAASAANAAAAAATAKAAGAAAKAPAPVKFTVPPPNAAQIELNGRSEVVLVGAGFPSAQPMFKLVSLAKNKKGKRIGVRISVVGGSFSGGDPTLLLVKGRKVTLADVTDGSRYVVEVVRLTNAVALPAAPAPSAQPTATASPGTTQPAPSAPAATTTTPAATPAPTKS